MRQLTFRQIQVFEFIKKNIKEHGVAPTLMEIAKALSFPSTDTVEQHLAILVEKKLIRLGAGSRDIKILKQRLKPSDLPLLGRSSANRPVPAWLENMRHCLTN